MVSLDSSAVASGSVRFLGQGLAYWRLLIRGAVVIAAKTVLQSSYTREAEAMADIYGAELMVKARGNPQALATMLGKIGGANEPGMEILLDHPDTKARIAAINIFANAAPTTPFLDTGEWATLKRICAG